MYRFTKFSTVRSSPPFPPILIHDDHTHHVMVTPPATIITITTTAHNLHHHPVAIILITSHSHQPPPSSFVYYYFFFDVSGDIAMITPSIHYTMGGIAITPRGEALDDRNAVIRGLYAAGEASGGVHGENRLGVHRDG